MIRRLTAWFRSLFSMKKERLFGDDPAKMTEEERIEYWRDQLVRSRTLREAEFYEKKAKEDTIGHEQ